MRLTIKEFPSRDGKAPGELMRRGTYMKERRLVSGQRSMPMEMFGQGGMYTACATASGHGLERTERIGKSWRGGMRFERGVPGRVWRVRDMHDFEDGDG